MKDKEKETNEANPDKDKYKPDQDMKDKLDEDMNDRDKPDENMKDKGNDTNKDKPDKDTNDGDNDETDKDESDIDKDESDEEMNDGDDKDKDQPDVTMTDGQKNLMVTYKPNTMDKSPKMLQHAYTYKTTNDGKRNDSIQNHHELASFVDESFIIYKPTSYKNYCMISYKIFV
jgi:hypothetical protein